MLMIANPAAPMVRARKLAEGGSAFLMLAVVAIVVTAIRQNVGEPMLQAMSAGLPAPAVLNITLINAIWLLPCAYLILALLELREALRECFMTAAAGEALRRAGYWSLWAMLAKMVIAPTVNGLFAPAPLGLVIGYESFDFGMIGFAALLMLAGVVLQTANTRTGGFA